MITTKAYLIREVKKLEKRKKQIQKEVIALQHKSVKDLFKKTSEILNKELLQIETTIIAYLWVANTNQNKLPKIKSKKKKPAKEKTNES